MPLFEAIAFEASNVERDSDLGADAGATSLNLGRLVAGSAACRDQVPWYDIEESCQGSSEDAELVPDLDELCWLTFNTTLSAFDAGLSTTGFPERSFWPGGTLDGFAAAPCTPDRPAKRRTCGATRRVQMTDSDDQAEHDAQSDETELEVEPVRTQLAARRKLLPPTVSVTQAVVAALAFLSLVAGVGVAISSSTHTSAADGRFLNRSARTSPAPRRAAVMAGPRGKINASAKPKPTTAATVAQNAGALGLPTGKRAVVLQWYAGPGGKALTGITNDYGGIMAAESAHQYNALKASCVQLAAEVQSARAAPAIPDAAMQRLYSSGLAELVKGTINCRAAISTSVSGDESVETHQRPRVLQQAISDFSSAGTDIFRATGEIEVDSKQT